MMTLREICKVTGRCKVSIRNWIKNNNLLREFRVINGVKKVVLPDETVEFLIEKSKTAPENKRSPREPVTITPTMSRFFQDFSAHAMEAKRRGVKLDVDIYLRAWRKEYS